MPGEKKRRNRLQSTARFIKERFRPPKVDKGFTSVKLTSRLAEYRGELPATVNLATHHLYCEKIKKEQSERLFSEGVYRIGKEKSKPTHALVCVCILYKEPDRPRIVFGSYLAIDFNDSNIDVFSNSVANAIATVICGDIAARLIASDRMYLIPCTPKEDYPFCLDSEQFEEHWAIELKLWTKLRINMFLRQK